MTERMSRRNALGWFAGASAWFTLGGCGASDLDNDSDAGTAATSTSTCEPTNEGEVGPYFADDSDARFNRSNILSNLDGSNTQTGVPLTLSVTVLDAKNGCAAMAGVQVDIWHCNSKGVYSDEASESTTGQQWLRGYQVTDANGKVTFTTIVPGWYSGRTKHIHLRLRSTYSEVAGLSDGTNTTQLFFTQSVDDDIDVNIYEEGRNATTNASDRVFTEQTQGANVLALSGDSSTGYVAAVSIFLPIS